MRNLVLSVVFILFPITAFSQETSARTDIFYDSGNNIVFATASLNPDYSTQYYYGIGMQTYISKTGYTSAPVTYDGYGPGSTYIETPAEAGYQYMTSTLNRMVIQYQSYEVIPGCYDCYDWYDSYGYDSLEGEGDPEQLDITLTVWVWGAPIIVMRTIEEFISLGQTVGRTRAPGEKVDFQVTLKSFIPWLYAWAGETCSDPVAGSSYVIYDGNNRTYSSIFDVLNSKATSVAYLLPDQGTGEPNTTWHMAGYTKRYSKQTGLDYSSGTGVLVEDQALHDCYKLDDQGWGGDSMHIDLGGNAGSRSAKVHFYGDARNELSAIGTWAPAISWDITVTVSKSNPSSPAYTIDYVHDCMPAFEIHIAGQEVYTRPPYPSGPEDWGNIAACLSGFGRLVDSKIGFIVQ